MLDLRRLGHLVALADERHFARAAQRVHLSQPAFSRNIQALEREFGQRLFDRGTGDVRPTPAGVFLIERARRLLFDARSLQRDAGLYAAGQLGDTAFGVGPFPAATLMPRVLPELRRRHPGVAVRVEVGNWGLLLEHLHAETIEFFVADVRSVPVDASLQIRPLGRQRGGFYVRSAHPLAGRPCTVAEFWAHGVASTRLPQVVKSGLGALLGLPPGQDPALALECDDIELLRAVALATDTVLGATDAAVQADVAAGRLAPLNVAGLPVLFSEMGVVSLHQRSLSPMARRAIELTEAAALAVNSAPAAAGSGLTSRNGEPPRPAQNASEAPAKPRGRK